MTDPEALVVDASVLAKWFLSPATEVGTAQARSLLGRYALVTTTLAHYEVGSALSRAWPEEPERVAKALTFIREHCGAPLELTADAAALTAELSSRHGITFYDASYAAIAVGAGYTLVSADRHLVTPGLAVELSAVAL